MRAEPTEAEAKLWSRLRAGRLQCWKFRHQVVFSGDYIADFVCPKAKLIVEVDGSQHGDQQAYDDRRTKFFEGQGYRVLRFWNNDVLARMDSVLEHILQHLNGLTPLPGAQGAPVPLPLREREVGSPLPQGERAGERSEPGEGI